MLKKKATFEKSGGGDGHLATLRKGKLFSSQYCFVLLTIFRDVFLNIKFFLSKNNSCQTRVEFKP
jgi:hypothetical protein